MYYMIIGYNCSENLNHFKTIVHDNSFPSDDMF